VTKKANEILKELCLIAGIQNFPALKITKVKGLKMVNKDGITISAGYMTDEHLVQMVLKDCVATYKQYFCDVSKA